jgi:hypothetical protein
MDGPEQCIVLKFLWLQEHGTKLIHALGTPAMSLPTVKRSAYRLREGDTACEDKTRLGRPLTILGDVLSKFLLNIRLSLSRLLRCTSTLASRPWMTYLFVSWSSENSCKDELSIRYRGSETKTTNQIKIVIRLTASTSRNWLQSGRDRGRLLVLLCVFWPDYACTIQGSSHSLRPKWAGSSKVIGCPTSSVAQANLTIEINFNILRSFSSSNILTIYLHAFCNRSIHSRKTAFKISRGISARITRRRTWSSDGVSARYPISFPLT